MLEYAFVEVGKEEGNWKAKEDVPENFQARALAIGLEMMDVHVMGVGGEER
jgi:D-tyrosyl-tRNA(Tyr) deacylase